MSRPWRDHRGTILYRGDAGILGRESFSINVRGHGRTIRAYCEMDEERIVRDTSWTLGPDWRPIEGHVRVVIGDILAGSSWYRVEDDHLECEGWAAELGRISERLEGRKAYLGLHPLIGDGMIAAARGTDAPGTERHIESVTCSYSPNGETGLTALPVDIGVTYLGEERVSVPAGTFDGRHYQLRWQPDWPAADLWVHGDDYLFLRLSWEASHLSFELAELHSNMWSGSAAA